MATERRPSVPLPVVAVVAGALLLLAFFLAAAGGAFGPPPPPPASPARARTRLRVVGEKVVYEDGSPAGDACNIGASAVTILTASGSHGAVERVRQCLEARGIAVELE